GPTMNACGLSRRPSIFSADLVELKIEAYPKLEWTPQQETVGLMMSTLETFLGLRLMFVCHPPYSQGETDMDEGKTQISA
ncbi:hypothetical protein PJP14_29120, partial [Mycobacterium kansasii]